MRHASRLGQTQQGKSFVFEKDSDGERANNGNDACSEGCGGQAGQEHNDWSFLGSKTSNRMQTEDVNRKWFSPMAKK